MVTYTAADGHRRIGELSPFSHDAPSDVECRLDCREAAAKLAPDSQRERLARPEVAWRCGG